MPQMALLLGYNAWGEMDPCKKMDAFQRFLAHKRIAIWRMKGNYTTEYLNQIPYPLNLYFFHKNIIRYRANCTHISRGQDWPLSKIPPEFHDDYTPYSIGIEIDKLEKVDDTGIWEFPKWDCPQERHSQGRLGILRVQDILAPSAFEVNEGEYSGSRLMRRCGQLGIPYQKAIESPYAQTRGWRFGKFKIQYRDGVDGTIGWGADKEPIRQEHTTPHTYAEMLNLLGLPAASESTDQ